MKLIRPLCALALLLSVSPSTQAAKYREGGIDGGGGGTLPIQPSYVQKINEIVHRNARRDLRLYVKYRQWGNTAGDSGLDQTLFGSGHPNLWEKLETTDIELLQDKPCRDAYGRKVDGSIHASRAGAICISAFSIAPKVDDAQAVAQTEALIVHELSHLLGANEAQARSIQRDYVYYTSKRREGDTLQFVTHGRDLIQDLSGRFYSLEARAEKGNLSAQQLASLVEEMSNGLSGFLQAALSTDLAASYFDGEEIAYLRVQEARLTAANWFINGMINASSGGSWQQISYDQAFEQDESVSFSTFEKRMYGQPLPENPWGEERIQRLHSAEETIAFLKQLHPYVRELSQMSDAFFFDMAIPRLHGPWILPSANPWAKFEGKFQVQSITCEGASQNSGMWTQLQALSVQKDRYGEWTLTTIWPGGSATQGAFDGASDTNGAAAVTVDGTQTTAERRVANGTPWSDFWGTSSVLMSQVADGFTVSVTESFRGQMAFPSNKAPNISHCRFRLTRQG